MKSVRSLSVADQQMVEIALRLLFYVTVLYAGQDFGGYNFFIYLNPLIGIVEFFRDTLGGLHTVCISSAELSGQMYPDDGIIMRSQV